MSSATIKTLGAVILALGVMLAASAAVQFGASDYATAVNAGQQVFNDAALKSAETVSPGARLAEWADAHLLTLTGGLVLIVLGAVLARVSDARHREVSLASAGAVNWSQSFDTLDSQMRSLRVEISAENADLDDLREQVDRLRQEVLEPVTAARHELEMIYGLAGFASVMGPLSGSERALNRCWTALADHHGPEAVASLDRSIAELGEAVAALGRLAGEKQ